MTILLILLYVLIGLWLFQIEYRNGNIRDDGIMISAAWPIMAIEMFYTKISKFIVKDAQRRQ